MDIAPNSTHHGRSEQAVADELRNPTIRTAPSTDNRPPTGPEHRRVRATPIAAVAVAAMLALATGCLSSTTPSTTTTTASGTTTSAAVAAASSANGPVGKEEVCAARDELKTSVTALTDASLLTGGTTGITAALGQVQTDLTAVKTAGKQTYGTEVDAMQSTVDQLKTVAGDLGNGKAAENLQSVGTAIAATGVAEDLFSKLASACGS